VTDGAPLNADARLSAFDELARLEASDAPQRRAWALWLLLLPMLAIAYPPLYSRRDPAVAGVPFFVWYLIVAVVFGGAVTGLVYALRGTERELTAPPGGDET
jgi:Protein of unknown function (DUF3311)